MNAHKNPACTAFGSHMLNAVTLQARSVFCVMEVPSFLELQLLPSQSLPKLWQYSAAMRIMVMLCMLHEAMCTSLTLRARALWSLMTCTHLSCHMRPLQGEETSCMRITVACDTCTGVISPVVFGLMFLSPLRSARHLLPLLRGATGLSLLLQGAPSPCSHRWANVVRERAAVARVALHASSATRRHNSLCIAAAA